MPTPRRLTLKREALAALTTDDLRGVVGGAVPPTSPVRQCLLEDSNVFCTGPCYTGSPSCSAC